MYAMVLNATDSSQLQVSAALPFLCCFWVCQEQQRMCMLWWAGTSS